MTLSTRIILGLLIGIAVGLFFGDYCFFLSYIGDGFISLLQMTVLPYIMVSIMANLGRLSLSEGKDLVVKGLKVLMVLLGLGVIMLLIMPLSLPPWSAGAFFRPSIVEESEALNFLNLYIPSNPFEAMADNVVPAVVLFSIFMGVGLSKIKGKDTLLNHLDIIADALNHINKMVVKLTPYGVFAIAAYNAGTMTVDEIQRLHAYIILYSVAVILLGFYWLPMLISVSTGVKYKALFGATKNTLLTIFATGKIIIVLPQLIGDIHKLLRNHNSIRADADTQKDIEAKTEIIMPLAYPFPNLGTFVIFVFVPFVAWYLGSALGVMDSLTFVGATLLSSFVAPVTGIPFILDVLKLPEDMFQLFVISSVYTDRIRVVLGAIHLIALTVITAQWTAGLMKVNVGRLIRGCLIGLALTVVLLIGTRIYLQATLGESHQYKSFIEMKFYDKNKALKGKEVTRQDVESNGMSFGESHLNIIKQTGVLRVGYYADALPYSFRNEEGKLLGFDIEMAYLLGEELGVEKVEFLKITEKEVSKYLKRGQLDIVMSGGFKTTDKLKSYAFSDTYMHQTLALIVPDYNRKKYEERDMLLTDSLSIGSVYPYFTERLKYALPNAKIVPLKSPRVFFRQEKELDALLFSAEAGAAWTVIYPSFAVTVPKPRIVQVPMSYPMPPNDQEWLNYVNTWLELRKNDGTVDILFDHWIMGEGTEEKEPRWCVIRDVLHWVD